jgi:hypothetical protein
MTINRPHSLAFQVETTKEQLNAVRSCVVVQVQHPVLRTEINVAVQRNSGYIHKSFLAARDYYNSY